MFAKRFEKKANQKPRIDTNTKQKLLIFEVQFVPCSKQNDSANFMKHVQTTMYKFQGLKPTASCNNTNPLAQEPKRYATKRKSLQYKISKLLR